MPSSRRIEGFESVHWKRWGDALRPGSPEPAGLVLITDAERNPLRAVHSVRGPIAKSASGFPPELAELASLFGCSWVVELGERDVSALYDQPWARESERDYLERLLDLWSALLELEGEGKLKSFPHRLAEWPALVGVAPHGLGALCPDEHSFVAAIWQDGRLATALSFRRRRGRIDQILGPTVLEPAMGLVSGDWTRDYRYLSQVVERLLGPLGLGVFARTSAVRELCRRGDAAEWARAVIARDVIISPLSSGLALPWGVDLGRAALRRVRDFASARGLENWVPPDLKGLFTPAVTRPDLRDFLGLDAFSLLRQAAAGGDMTETRASRAPLASAGE